MLKKLLKTKILVLDGAMGTSLQNFNLSPEDFGGEQYDGCNENLVLTNPEIITRVHESYLEAGADIIETNTFGGTPVVLEEYQLQNKFYEINFEATKLAKLACQKYTKDKKPRFVAGSMGPTTKSLSVTGGITFDELATNFKQQAIPLIEGGSDYLLLETALDTLNLKAGYIGILQAFEDLGKELPIAISGTIETMGTMLAGQGVDALYTSIEHMNLLYIGLNCATGPAFMRDHIRSLAAIARCPVAIVPNAGLPNEDGEYLESPNMVAKVLQSFMNEGWVNILGGCCGTTPDHIQAMTKIAADATPRTVCTTRDSRTSGIETLLLEDDGRPYIVGERTNVIGSRLFKNMIIEEKFEEAAEIARKQVKAGAHIIDVCLSNPDRDEESDIIAFLSIASKLLKAPFMIDSQVPSVVEEAFKLTQGKCILNSVNLEDGEKSFEELLPIVKKYGAAIIVGCIEGEMAVTAEEKLTVAINSHKLLTQKYGIPEEDIIFDPLVFPCGTGDKNYFGSGKETIEGVRLIKEHFPRCKTTLGISNVSFGLPPAGREALNTVFVYHCTKAGLDTAIVNSEKMVRYATLSDEERKLCDDMLWYNLDNGNDPIGNFVTYYRDKSVQEKPKVDRSKLSVKEKLEINIVEGTKEFLIENLAEALQELPNPLAVINGPLMAAMAIVGRMFNANELIVAEVLQSAESMKAAVTYLEGFMDAQETNVKGTIILATVKGDVHDIGKNLVEIILGNNGYKVVNLGIKCPSDVLIKAAKEHNPDLIGLSGLLVKSAQQMVISAKDMKESNITTPILVGGAALSENFTVTKIGQAYDGLVVYCKDAMNGLDVSNHIVDPQLFKDWKPKFLDRCEQVKNKKQVKVISKKAKLILNHSAALPEAPDFDTHIVTYQTEEIWPYLNENMLYGKNLGLKGSIKRLVEQGDQKAIKLKKTVDDIKTRILNEKIFKPTGMYQFFKVKPNGNSIIVFDAKGQKELERFEFPRQENGELLCLSNFLNPKKMDTFCAFVTTAGCDVGKIARKYLDDGDYVLSHTFFALAMETAESLAEVIHRDIRDTWGIPDAPDLSVQHILQAKYTGVRVSFGYPACPNLDDQQILWRLLKPDKHLSVHLTEDCMMEPEASVSALVFHHPEAKYFSV
jgi:5-methyltetrahydrofolate--homocysteine methyltransferase